MARGGKKAKQEKGNNEKQAAQRRASSSQAGAPRAPTQLPHEDNTLIGCTTLHSFTIVAFDSAPLTASRPASSSTEVVSLMSSPRTHSGSSPLF
jgi:hypothetical protein